VALFTTGKSRAGNTVEDVIGNGKQQEYTPELSEITYHRSQLTLKLGDSADDR